MGVHAFLAELNVGSIQIKIVGWCGVFFVLASHHHTAEAFVYDSIYLSQKQSILIKINSKLCMYVCAYIYVCMDYV